MFVSTAALLLATALQAPNQEPAQDAPPPPLPPPFELALPEGYGAFLQVDPTLLRWVSRRADDLGAFTVEHFEVTAPGANQDSTAAQLADYWQRQLAGTDATLEKWTGDWSGRPASGVAVRYTRDGRSLSILERLLLVEDRLIHAVWEGPRGQEPAAQSALAGAAFPAEWFPPPPPEHDPQRGLGEFGPERPFPGALRLHVDLSGIDSQQLIVVEIVWDAPEGMTTEGWVLPPAAQQLAASNPSAESVRYRLRVDDGAGAGSPYGMVRPAIGHGLAALNANWLAVPSVLIGTEHGYQAPNWTLRLSYPGNLTAFSHAPGQRVFDEDAGMLQSTYPPCAAGQVWPFFLVSAVEPRKEEGVQWSLRKDAKATSPEVPIRGLLRLEKILDAWLPNAAPLGHLTSYPGTGDRAMPGLIVLDENEDWYGAPLDAPRQGLTRRVWLARVLTASTFGAHLKAVGSGAPFLEASLSEYAAWRLLEQEWPEDAKVLQAHWQEREAALGPLPMPLSLMPPEDAFGARRLQSRGPLVWLALERKAGREVLDGILNAALAKGSPWTTRDLEAALDAASDQDWKPFFRDYVYGRLTPKADN